MQPQPISRCVCRHMCEENMLAAANRTSAPLPPPRPDLYTYGCMSAAPQNEDDVRRIVKDGGIEFLFAQFVDMHGKPSAKLVPADHLDDLLGEGAGFAGFAAGDIGQGPDDPDIIAMPDPRSLTILPWRKNVARLACDVTVEGEAWPYCPRTILRGAIERAAGVR